MDLKLGQQRYGNSPGVHAVAEDFDYKGKNIEICGILDASTMSVKGPYYVEINHSRVAGPFFTISQAKEGAKKYVDGK